MRLHATHPSLTEELCQSRSWIEPFKSWVIPDKLLDHVARRVIHWVGPVGETPLLDQLHLLLQALLEVTQ